MVRTDQLTQELGVGPLADGWDRDGLVRVGCGRTVRDLQRLLAGRGLPPGPGAPGNDDSRSQGKRRRRLDAHAVRLIRRCLREPVTVFSHLLLVALDLGRLRNGLVRRALFGDWPRAA